MIDSLGAPKGAPGLYVRSIVYD